jgi:hypothetical protein
LSKKPWGKAKINHSCAALPKTDLKVLQSVRKNRTIFCFSQSGSRQSIDP